MKHFFSILILLGFISATNADNPLTIFGITIGDDVINYQWMKDYTIDPEARTQNFHIMSPEPNSSFDEYWVWIACGNNKIYSISAKSPYRSLEANGKMYQDIKTALVNKYGNENNVIENNDTVYGGPKLKITLMQYE